MTARLESLVQSIRDLLTTSELSLQEAQLLGRWFLQTGSNIRGYNNYQNDLISGERFFRNQILSRLSPCLCVDVGANVGNYSEGLLHDLRSNVVAFEPLLLAYSQLDQLKEKYPTRFIAENLAVGAKNGTGTINFNPEATEHASMTTSSENVSYLNNSYAQDINIVSLDEYFSSSQAKPDFIKIDVEGLEHDVLLGAKDLLTNSAPKCIQIEMNWHQLFRQHSLWSLSQHLQGYHVYQLLQNAISLKDPRDPLANLFMFSNFIFIRDDMVDLLPAELIVSNC
jgi:FkbM family methyltransferase